MPTDIIIILINFHKGRASCLIPFVSSFGDYKPMFKILKIIICLLLMVFFTSCGERRNEGQNDEPSEINQDEPVVGSYTPGEHDEQEPPSIDIIPSYNDYIIRLALCHIKK